MKTVKDAMLAVTGPGGAAVRSKPDHIKRSFMQKAAELGHQIARDNNVDFNTGDVPNNTPLSDEATLLLEELQSIKEGILFLDLAV